MKLSTNSQKDEYNVTKVIDAVDEGVSFFIDIFLPKRSFRIDSKGLYDARHVVTISFFGSVPFMMVLIMYHIISFLNYEPVRDLMNEVSSSLILYLWLCSLVMLSNLFMLQLGYEYVSTLKKLLAVESLVLTFVTISLANHTSFAIFINFLLLPNGCAMVTLLFPKLGYTSFFFSLFFNYYIIMDPINYDNWVAMGHMSSRQTVKISTFVLVADMISCLFYLEKITYIVKDVLRWLRISFNSHQLIKPKESRINRELTTHFIGYLVGLCYWNVMVSWKSTPLSKFVNNTMSLLSVFTVIILEVFPNQVHSKYIYVLYFQMGLFTVCVNEVIDGFTHALASNPLFWSFFCGSLWNYSRTMAIVIWGESLGIFIYGLFGDVLLPYPCETWFGFCILAPRYILLPNNIAIWWGIIAVTFGVVYSLMLQFILIIKPKGPKYV